MNVEIIMRIMSEKKDHITISEEPKQENKAEIEKKN